MIMVTNSENKIYLENFSKTFIFGQKQWENLFVTMEITTK